MENQHNTDTPAKMETMNHSKMNPGTVQRKKELY